MPIIRHTNSPDAVWTRRPDHDVYDHEKIDLVSRTEAKGCVAALIKLPPKKAGFPYHYHTINEECFFELDAAPVRVSAKMVPTPFNHTLEKASIPNAKDVVAAVLKMLGK